MNVWMAMKGALTVMDMVTRGWAKELEIDECGVMVLMQLGSVRSSSAAKLGLQCGRARPQVHRSLRLMQAAGLVQPATVARNGCTASWTLTAKGRRRWSSLERAVCAWEDTMARTIDLPQLVDSLSRVVESSVNRPSADGWRDGLIVPHELRIVPLWYQTLIEDSLLELNSSEPEPELEPHDEEAAQKEREQERAEKEWSAMWMRLSS